MKQFNRQEYLENPNRTVVTRDGRNARILCVDRKFRFNGVDYPVLALVKSTNGEEFALSFTSDGREEYNYDGTTDLFFVPNKKEGWINLYNSYGEKIVGRHIYESEKAARVGIDQTNLYITTIKIEWEE